MAANTPLNQLTLVASSVADDLGYVALADIASAFEAAATGSYRIIGGHMVTALVARWALGSALHRETQDTDLGSPPTVIRDNHIVERLIDLGYAKVDGNRFAKSVDVPVKVHRGGHDGQGVGRQAIIDLLIPTYRTRVRQNHKVSDLLVTTEVPGLATALQRPPLDLNLRLRRLDGQVLDVNLMFPDEVAALVLKAHVAQLRTKSTDVVDLWRCLEVAYAAGVDGHQFRGDESIRAAQLVRTLFRDRNGSGMTALQAEQGLSRVAGDVRFTRLRALVARVLGRG